MSSETKTPKLSKRDKRRRIERMLAVGAIVLIAVVWIVSATRSEANYADAVQEALPEAHHFDEREGKIFAAWADADEQELLGYVAIGTANGYGGELELAVAVNPEGSIIGLSVVTHKETQSWFDRVLNQDFTAQLTGKSYWDSFEVGSDVDGVTGATYTSRALAQAALEGSRLGARALDLDVSESEKPQIQFGVPEIVILALFATGYIGHRRGFKYKRQVRWGSMLTGLIVLGFLYNIPITVAYFTKLILGYWPEWQTNLYWYFLIGGLIFVVTADNKNPYCEWFCPFGAAQECMGVIGGAKPYTLRQHRHWLTWLQRGLALIAILLGVYFRNPGVASYEVFGTLFSFFGNTIMVAVLAMVLIMALFVKRPWCNFLCPIDPIVEFIRVMRQWVNELWQKINPRAKSA